MNGIQLLSALEEDPDPNIQAIPVIVLSARGGSEAENRPEDGIFQGAVDFLPKVRRLCDLNGLFQLIPDSPSTLRTY